MKPMRLILNAVFITNLTNYGSVSVADDFAAKAKATNRPQTYARGDFVAEVGVRAELVGRGDILVGVDFLAFERVCKARDAGDAKGLEESEKAGDFVREKPGAKVLILEVRDFGEASPAGKCAEVRLVDVEGPNVGKKGWVRLGQLADMVPFPLRVGEVGVIDGRPFAPLDVPIAASRESWNQFGDAWNANDRRMMVGMEANGKVTGLVPGTRVKVRAICLAREFQADFGLKHMGVNVEVVSGPFKGVVGWVLPDAIIKGK